MTYTNMKNETVTINARIVQDMGMIKVFMTEDRKMISAMQDGSVFDVTDGKAVQIGSNAQF